MDAKDPWKAQTAALGSFIRTQRQLADLSLRELATITHVSNAYLSQIERGLHQPSVRVISAIAEALQVPADQLLAEAGMVRHDAAADNGAAAPDGTGAPTNRTGASTPSTEAAILADPALTAEQRQALLGVYRSFVPPDP